MKLLVAYLLLGFSFCEATIPSRQEWLQASDTQFHDYLDRDKDGKVSDADYLAALKQHDKNDDNKLTFDEFNDTKMPLDVEEHLFEYYDKDGDNYIEYSELQQHVTETDTNSDGFVSLAEFEAEQLKIYDLNVNT